MTPHLSRRQLLRAVGATGLVLAAGPSLACQVRDQCDPVGDRAFGSGTIKRQPDCIIDFRLPPEIERAITLSDGSLQWVLRLMTLDSQGRVRWTTAHRVTQPVRRQGVYHGTIAAVYVTCDEFTGWLATGPINQCGTTMFRRVNWNLDYRVLDRMSS